MTTAEIRVLNRGMWERFKPERIEEVDGVFGLVFEGRHGKLILWEWTPATDLTEAAICADKVGSWSLKRQFGNVGIDGVWLWVYAAEASGITTHRSHAKHAEPAAALCLALLEATVVNSWSANTAACRNEGQ